MLAALSGGQLSSARGEERLNGTAAQGALPVRLAVLGDSDSHAFHDRIDLRFGTEKARGGAQQANTWQWTEVLAKLRADQVDQGAFGEVGGSRAVTFMKRRLLGMTARHHKEDFLYNFAVSGAECQMLNRDGSGQVPALLAEMDRDRAGWTQRPAAAVIRIGINNLGKAEDLAAFAKDGPSAANVSKINDCATQVEQAVRRIKSSFPALSILLVGVLNNVDWPPFHGRWQDARDLANIDAVLNVFDQRLRDLAKAHPGVRFFDDRAFFSRHFGGRDKDGKPAYKQLSLGGSRGVEVSQGDEPFHAVLKDGHAGTVWNGLWAASIVAELNQMLGVKIAPITEAEVARLADPQGQFGLWR
ncbi:MAG: GDSL-type esterase/lipase family protein [Lautropia sp.]|nr:GDSL-type esterase/lipase family protein [Lautropia sp.]